MEKSGVIFRAFLEMNHRRTIDNPIVASQERPRVKRKMGRFLRAIASQEFR
jgi:hypothetical protein